MKWAGHIVRMKDERLPKRSETKKQEGCRKQGRPHLGWEDCVKRDLRKAEEEEKWSEKTNIKDQWQRNYKKLLYSEVTTRPALPLRKGNQRKNKMLPSRLSSYAGLRVIDAASERLLHQLHVVLYDVYRPVLYHLSHSLVVLSGDII